MKTVEEYDPLTNTWSTKANMPCYRYELALGLGGQKSKVSQHKDINDNIKRYSYDVTNRRTTITDSNNNTIVKEYDSSYYITKSTDPDNRQTIVEYYKYEYVNKYGEEKSIIDRNGN